MIANLSGPDNGPYSLYSVSQWQKKMISSSSNNMLVKFISDGILFLPVSTHILIGFSAFIRYLPLPSELCQKGVNMTMGTIQSPNYPYLYQNDLECKWLITVPHHSYITLTFLQIDV